MNYTSDPQFLAMVFLLPGLFGFTLLGDGVNKIMNYDNHGWIAVCAGGAFVVVVILAYFVLSSNV